ncbi:TetR/AcrR family transcriptional regulator [Nocardia fusca]|uniref:TetR/AcrR family transcriptional regulator n=1 Tax=Nocardia fusca TaxID=941183 RepID=UPI0037B44CA1
MSDAVDALGTVGDVRGDRRVPSKGERQRRAILDSVAHLLAVRPIGELTVGEIAADAGVGRSGFYVYFETKYTAIAVLTSEIWEALMQRVDAFTRRADESAEEYLLRIGSATLQIWRDNDAVLIASIQAAPLDEQLAAMWQSWNGRLADILTVQVLRDRDNDRAHPISTDVPTLVSTLLECTQHMFYLDRLHKCDDAETSRMFATIRAMWVSCAWGATPASAP